MKIKVTAAQYNHVCCTVGKIYEANALADGAEYEGSTVRGTDGCWFIDDVGDKVGENICNGLELVEE